MHEIHNGVHPGFFLELHYQKYQRTCTQIPNESLSGPDSKTEAFRKVTHILDPAQLFAYKNTRKLTIHRLNVPKRQQSDHLLFFPSGLTQHKLSTRQLKEKSFFIRNLQLPVLVLTLLQNSLEFWVFLEILGGLPELGVDGVLEPALEEDFGQLALDCQICNKQPK